MDRIKEILSVVGLCLAGILVGILMLGYVATDVWYQREEWLLMIPFLGLWFGSWWICKKGEVIAQLSGMLCPKCRENSKYLLKKAKRFIVVTQIILFLALLVTVGYLFLWCVRYLFFLRRLGV